MKGRRRSGDLRTAFDAISAPSAAFDVLSFAGSSEARRLALRLLVTNTHVALCQLYSLLVGGEGCSHAEPDNAGNQFVICSYQKQSGVVLSSAAVISRLTRHEVPFNATKGQITDSWERRLYQRRVHSLPSIQKVRFLSKLP